MNCQFNTPVTWENIPPVGKAEIWNFKTAVCDYSDATITIEQLNLYCPTSTLELIQNPETNAEFYLDKTINYGDTLVLFFLLLFAIFGVIKIISDFWLPRRVTKF